MGLFRFATFAISMGLVISLVAPAQATTKPSTPPPPPSLTDSHTLNLRTAGSRLVVDAIEDALRQKGLALFDEGFQLDSSLSWVFGENIEGEIDAVVPLWSGNGNAVFAQPGFVFWTGLADEERIDGNLGIAYRTGLTEDVIGGASVFYDRDFKQGHSRISLGADVQSGFFHGAANYYQPLSDEEDGREGFIEEALRGMDFRLAVQRDIMRASANLGYWRFEGEDAVEADWKISYALMQGFGFFQVFLLRVDGNIMMKMYRSTTAGTQAWRFASPFPISRARAIATDQCRPTCIKLSIGKSAFCMRNE